MDWRTENHQVLPYPEQDIREFTAADEREIDARIEERAKGLALVATYESASVDQLLDDALEDEDGGVYLQSALADILRALPSLREEVSCFTTEERIEAFIHRVQKAILPLARLEAETHREAIEDQLARELA